MENERKETAGKKEFSAVSIIIGILMAVLFGAANAYLGLRVGMTVSASIPAAVISMGIIRFVMRRNSILENNMVQTIGSAGESLAAGAIFTMPVLFMWAGDGQMPPPSLLEITMIALCGGILGVLFMIPLRYALIVKENHVLPYPEGTACARVLKAGENGGVKAVCVFAGLSIAAVYKLLADGIKWFPSEVDYAFKRYKGAGIGIDVLPALTGVGYICGFRTSALILGGGIFSWLVLMPLLSMFGGESVIFPAQTAVADMGTWELWGSYVRYVGAGAVAAGGLISLVKSFPLIVQTFRRAIRGFQKNGEDIPIWVVALGILAIALIMWIVPVIPVNFFGALIIIVFGFFFATVSSRMVGLVGSSNNPVSGMTIATLIITALLFKITGNDAYDGMVASITVGTIICIVAAMAGDTSQDLKTGFLVGATPKKQQYGEIIGAVVSAVAIGGVLYLLNSAWGYGTTELPAPQATLMRMVVEGVMGENLPWTLILAGAAVAVILELLGIAVLPFAVGMYLPIHLSAAIMTGGLVRLWVEHRKRVNEETKKQNVESGILFASGMIAGEGLIGILLAVLAVIPLRGQTIADVIQIPEKYQLGNIGAIFTFGVLIAAFIWFIIRDSVREASA